MVENQTLSLAMRPRRLSEIIGYEDIVSQIRSQLQSGRIPVAWLFGGDLGSGKTTLARIMAVALQCTHGEVGEPCDACLAEYWDIQEINAADVNGVNEMRTLTEKTSYLPAVGRYKIIILDEAHRITEAAQNLLLKHFEPSAEQPHTIWIICTSEPKKILPALRSRCIQFIVNGLDEAQMSVLVATAMAKVKSALDQKALVQALTQAQIRSPRIVLFAVEKYIAGASAEAAALVAEPTTADTLAICRAAVQGNWGAVQRELLKAAPADGRILRVAVAGYFRSVMLKASSTARAKVCADAITELTRVNVFEDGLQLSAMAAALFNICDLIKTHRN